MPIKYPTTVVPSTPTIEYVALPNYFQGVVMTNIKGTFYDLSNNLVTQIPIT